MCHLHSTVHHSWDRLFLECCWRKYSTGVAQILIFGDGINALEIYSRNSSVRYWSTCLETGTWQVCPELVPQGNDLQFIITFFKTSVKPLQNFLSCDYIIVPPLQLAVLLNFKASIRYCSLNLFLKSMNILFNFLRRDEGGLYIWVILRISASSWTHLSFKAAEDWICLQGYQLRTVVRERVLIKYHCSGTECGRRSKVVIYIFVPGEFAGDSEQESIKSQKVFK